MACGLRASGCTAAIAVLAGVSCGAAAAGSRAAWWLQRDGVRPVADLVNAARPGSVPVFCDRIGLFEVLVDGRALIVSGSFPSATVWRFDLATFDGRFDMRRLYVPYGFVAFPDRNSIQTRRLAKLLGDADKALTHTGPWEIFNGQWLVPTARVALDGRHVYTSWFDLPSLSEQAAGRLYASFAIEIDKPGKHTVRISFDDFPRHTRWRPSRRRPNRPEVTHTPNPLRPHDIGSIAVGLDERVGDLVQVRLKPALVGKHPRLSGAVPPAEPGPALGPDDEQVQRLITHLDPDRGELWEYSDDAESMASGNDMDAGRKGLDACRTYDRLLPRLTAEARSQVDRAFLKRFEGIYRYFVFQRNYNATGYAQNHCSKAIWALVGAGLVWDGPRAGKWLRWAVMTCRKRVELLGRDGGLEWMNEGRDYGLGFWETSRRLIKQCTGRDLAAGPFFENEWRYALHNAPAFPKNGVPVMLARHAPGEEVNVPLPEGVTPAGTPTGRHFDDCDQVFMRSDWGGGALRVRMTAGTVFGKTGAAKALRYNWAHCPVNRGSIALWKGSRAILNEPGWDRTYRKSAANNNCILVNDTDQYGGGQVWHPRLSIDQVGRIACFADGDLLCVARADLKNAYPPAARVRALSRVLVQVRPDHFLVFDQLETRGEGRGEWRFHAAFVEPAGAGRHAVFAARPRTTGRAREKPTTYGAAFAKDAGAGCEIAFLTPGVEAKVGMSDVYFRWHAFRQPMRHLRVVRAGAGPIRLLTAFAPRLRVASKGRNVHVGRADGVSWVVLVGGGSAEDLRCDADFAIAARDVKTGAAEAYRFGGSRVELAGLAVRGKAPDSFAAIRNGKLVRVVSTDRDR